MIRQSDPVAIAAFVIAVIDARWVHGVQTIDAHLQQHLHRVVDQ